MFPNINSFHTQNELWSCYDFHGFHICSLHYFHVFHRKIKNQSNESRKTCRKQLAENWSKILGGKLVEKQEKQLAENSPSENLSQEHKIISDKYSAYFVIVLCY